MQMKETCFHKIILFQSYNATREKQYRFLSGIRNDLMACFIIAIIAKMFW